MEKETVTSIIQTNKCYYCSLRLTVSPIMKSNIFEQQYYRCGRCENINRENLRWFKFSQFDDIAQHMTFPCSFSPCKIMLPWTSVQGHENECCYRTLRCPRCNSLVRPDKFVEHFKENHNHNIETTGVIWNGYIDGCVNLLIQEDEHFFVYILKCDCNYYVTVLSIERTKYTKYNLKLFSRENENFEISFNNLPVLHYEERLHCYSCLKKKCGLMCHPYSDVSDIKTTCLFVRNCHSFLNCLNQNLMDGVNESYCSGGYIRCSITLIRDEPSEAAPDVEVEQNACNNTKALVGALNCPYCMTYMEAPIFTCTTGHTICNACRPKRENCPTCLASLGETRNYTLEELSKTVSVPCQYQDKGCTFTGTVDKIIPHEQECSFNNSLKE